MRRITLWIASTITALVLLLSYRTSTMGAGGTTPVASSTTVSATQAPSGGTTTAAPADPGDPTGSSSDDGSSTAAPSPAPSSSTASGSGSSTSGTFTGDSVDTQWGPVQVQITLSNGRITDASAVVYPQNNHRDVEINEYALPVLHDETIAAQSAQIDTVSGATVTSVGYTSSLQSAIDAAHLGS